MPSTMPSINPSTNPKIVEHTALLLGLGLGSMAWDCVQVDPNGFEPCRQGTKYCACAPLDKCDSGLECVDDRCTPNDQQVPSMADQSTGGEPGEPEGSQGNETTTSAMTESGEGDHSDHGEEGDEDPEFDFYFDVSPYLDMGHECPQHDEYQPTFIWIPNTDEDTISKIDVETSVEIERHRTVPPGHEGAPARVSVNRRGEVVVANRHGGVVKFYATGAPDPYQSPNDHEAPPWDSDASRAWYQPLEPHMKLDALAWTPGRCCSDPVWGMIEHDEKVWVAGVAEGRVAVFLLNAETGKIEQTFDEDRNLDLAEPSRFIGAVVDADGSFWGIRPELDQLISIDLETHDIHSWPTQADVRGLAVDQQGSIWTCAAAELRRLDPSSKTWISVKSAHTDGTCVVDTNGTLWVTSSESKLYKLDDGSLTVDTGFDLESPAQGLSIDFYDRLWAVSNKGVAHRYDPHSPNGDLLTIEIPPGAITNNSDMTGFHLHQRPRCTEPPPAPAPAG